MPGHQLSAGDTALSTCKNIAAPVSSHPQMEEMGKKEASNKQNNKVATDCDKGRNKMGGVMLCYDRHALCSSLVRSHDEHLFLSEWKTVTEMAKRRRYFCLSPASSLAFVGIMIFHLSMSSIKIY